MPPSGRASNSFGTILAGCGPRTRGDDTFVIPQGSPVWSLGGRSYHLERCKDDDVTSRDAEGWVGTSAAILLRDLLQDALDDGGSDNITLIVCRTVRNDS